MRLEGKAALISGGARGMGAVWARLFANEETRRVRMSHIHMGRMGTADDVASRVPYLASDDSSYMTGSELVIDGGFTA